MTPTDTPRGPGRPPLPPDQAATAFIKQRCTRARKNAYVRAARPGTLRDWMFKWLDKASGYREEK